MTEVHDLVPAVMDGLELEWEAGVNEHEWVVTLPGEKKLKTVVSLLIRGDHLVTRAFVIRNPDENHAEVYRFLLRRNLRMPLLGYAVDADGDVWLRGQTPTAGLDTAYLDRLFGVALEGADQPFNDLLVLGFLTSMQKEWAWRIDRGESLRNLEAFRGILERPGDPPPDA